MGINLGVGEWIVICLSAALGVWFLAGIAVNRKLGPSACAWLAAELRGSSSGLHWLDLATAAASVKPEGPGLPFRRLEAILALERRENFPLWLFQHLAGRRDSLLIRAALDRPPGFELHLVPRQEYALLGELKQRESLSLREEFQGFKLFCSAEPAETAVAAVKAFVERFPGSLLRVSLQQKAPQLIIHFELAPLQATPKDALLEAIRELVQSL